MINDKYSAVFSKSLAVYFKRNKNYNYAVAGVLVN